MAVGLALTLTDFLIGRCTINFGTRWLMLPHALLWMSTLIYIIAPILRAVFGSREMTARSLLVLADPGQGLPDHRRDHPLSPDAGPRDNNPGVLIGHVADDRGLCPEGMPAHLQEQ
jgi:hypothetical protein